MQDELPGVVTGVRVESGMAGEDGVKLEVCIVRRGDWMMTGRMRDKQGRSGSGMGVSEEGCVG